MDLLDRITLNPAIMGGKPCIRGLRITAGVIVGLVAARCSFEEILDAYPDLEHKDILAALQYAAWRLQNEQEVLLKAS
ncbi:MAG: DUF433 domain-containing protein [Gammaproteobacteria bacterium]|nr:DUF433 domain-containing protein [Gammaproteobacteria bacterium]